MKGTITRLTDRGFGFIKPEGSDKDVFFHAKELDGIRYEELHEGDEVTFEMSETPKGNAAVAIRRA